MKSIHWGWRIGVLYGVFAIGTVSWVTYAMTKEVDLVRTDYYQYSLKQDQTSAARYNADRLGASASITVEKSSSTAPGDLCVRVPVQQAANATGQLALYRPNSMCSDVSLPLQISSDGSMHTPTTKLAKGVWNVTMTWSSNGTSYEISKRIVL